VSGSLGVGDSVLLGVVRAQRGRLVASVMGAIEEELPGLSGEAKDRVRGQVVRAASSFAELAIDALRSARDQSDYTNDQVLILLSEVKSRGGQR